MPFSQAQQSTSKNFGGTGLGLWISKKLINKMDGDIHIVSTKGKGSDFICTLNVKVVSPKEQRSDVVSSNQKLRALFLEDQPFNAKVIKGMLERLNMEVYQASNGMDGLQIYRRYSEGYFNFIMTDLNMPIMDGKEFIQKMKEYEREHMFKIKTPIIVLTGNNDETEKKICLDLGADYYWTKPLSHEKLQQVLYKLRKRGLHFSSKMVLIIDDDVYCAKITQKLLEEEGFITKSVTKGSEALHIINTEYDNILVVLTDAEMPEISGYDIAEHIRKLESDGMKNKQLPIICLSGHANNLHTQKAKQSGINEVLLKPVHKNVLIERILQIV